VLNADLLMIGQLTIAQSTISQQSTINNQQLFDHEKC